jgi:hypothetical protein
VKKVPGHLLFSKRRHVSLLLVGNVSTEHKAAIHTGKFVCDSDEDDS